MKQIIQKDKLNGCRVGFNYQNVKPYKYIIEAYRTYKKNGIKTLKVLNCDLIAKSVSVARAIDPQEADAIRDNIKSQIGNLVNTTVQEVIKK